jgi:hypothetical protein
MTTVLGILALPFDVFWMRAAAAAVAGFSIRTVFTMTAVSVLYTAFHRSGSTLLNEARLA